MNVSTRLVPVLQAVGHDVAHMADRQGAGMPDTTIFAIARAEQRIVVTGDLDFAYIAAVAARPAPTVVILRLRNPRFLHTSQALANALQRRGPSQLNDTVVIVEDGRIRVRQFRGP